MVMIYDTFKMETQTDYVKLSAEAIIQFKDVRDELYGQCFSFGTPKCWDDAFLEKINILLYDIYYLCTSTVSLGNYNSVTDYKKVWGLIDITPGIYDNSYLIQRGKVYFGIKQVSGKNGFLSAISPTLILVPKEKTILSKEIFNIFERNEFDFLSDYTDGYNLIFSEIQRLIPNSILLRCGDGLNIYGKDIEKLFTANDIQKWEDNAPTSDSRSWRRDWSS